MLLLLLGLVLCASGSPAVWAQRAVIVVDADDGSVLHARNATERMHPASLTKMMTVYLALEAIDKGKVKADDTLVASARAAAQGGAILGLDTGSRIGMLDAVRAIIARSANDVAVAMAEHLAGDESAFAGQMTAKARDLGMVGTVFANATGLTAAGHLSTARDMALLAVRLRRDFPKHAGVFSARTVTWNKQTLGSVNGFLAAYPGATGMKTGFTCAAGYNLAASAQRGGRALVGVVMGSSTKEERLGAMRRLLDDGFAGVYKTSIVPINTLVEVAPAGKDARADACGGVPMVGIGTPGDRSGGGTGAGLKGWALDVGIFPKQGQAVAAARKALGKLGGRLKGGRAAAVVRAGDGRVAYRALIVGAPQPAVVAACLAMRKSGQDCLVMDPPMLGAAIEDARRYVRFFAKG